MSTREDPVLYREVILRYAEALLASKLSALRAAQRLDDNTIFREAATDFTHFAQLHSLLVTLRENTPDAVRHNCARFFAHLKQNTVVIHRVRRPPQVHGDEIMQLQSTYELLSLIPTSPSDAYFRLRNDRFAMTLEWRRHIPPHINTLLLTQDAERTLVHNLAEDWLEAYIRLRALRATGMQVGSNRLQSRRITFTWPRARQLQIAL